jgi:DNA polymerase III delta subunit
MIVFVTSPAYAMLDEHIESIASAFKSKAGSSANLVRMSLSAQDRARTLFETWGARSLFSKKQMVVVRHALELPVAEQREIVSYLKAKRLSTDTTLLFVEREPLPPATKAPLLAFLKKSALVKRVTSASPTPAKVVEWLQKRAKNLGVSIGRAEVELLMTRAQDVDRAAQALETLALYALARGATSITRQEILDTVAANIETDIFETISALAQRDLARTLELLHHHLAQGAHPLYLLTMLRYQFRSLVLIQDAATRSRDAGIIASQTKLPPFVVRKSLGYLSAFPGDSLKKIFSKLVDADQAIKTGRIDGDVALDSLAFAICR